MATFGGKAVTLFPISRDPPEGGTLQPPDCYQVFAVARFQFLGIPPKGEPSPTGSTCPASIKFPISRDPPEGGTFVVVGVTDGSDI